MSVDHKEMKKTGLASFFAFIAFFVVATTSTSLQAKPLCPTPWHCESNLYSTTPKTVSIRSGYLAENAHVPFRGNIIYYEGLGDSMLNHLPLFEKLTQAGYRVIAFDYMGQGGSAGDMNDTRIADIAALGEQVWQRHARDLTKKPQKAILGWSTGGLAAYLEAHQNPNVKSIVLMAPGIVPKLLVGEQDPLQGQITHITLESLTSQVYREGVLNPHVDPIRPEFAIKLPLFALDFLQTAVSVQQREMRPNVKGLVLLSGKNDSYIHARATENVIRRNAPHFEFFHFPKARHELDNEVEEIRWALQKTVLEFLDRNH